MLELLAMVCLGAAWLVPSHFPPWMSFYSETCSGLALLLLWLATVGRKGNPSAPLSAWFVLAVAAVPIAQWGAGVLAFSGDAWVAALYLGMLSTAITVGFAWADAEVHKAAAMLSVAVLVASTLSSALALCQFLNVGQFDLWMNDVRAGSRSVANLGQPNNLGTLIGLGTVSLLLLHERGHLGVTASSCLLALLLGGAAATQSRTALLFGPIVMTGLLVVRRRGVKFKTTGIAVALATVAHWALSWAFPALQAALLLTKAGSLAERGIETPRLQMWPMLVDATTQLPWMGYGWLQVGAAELSVVNKYPPVGELWLHGHNLFLELIVWCGYPLGLLLCGALIYWFVSRVCKVNTVEATVGMLALSILGAHAMLELPHHYAYFLIPAGLWIGQIEAARGERGPLPMQWNMLPGLLSLLLAVAIWMDYPAVEEDFRLARFENMRIGTVHAPQPAPDAPFLSSLTGFLRFVRTTPVRGMTEAELNAMESVVKRYPYAPSLARLAAALALNGRANEARERFISIRQMFGEGTYRKLRLELREKINDGEPTELDAFERSLPD